MDLGPTLLPWWQNFLCIELSFLRNLWSTKFHSIIVDHIICLLTCKPTDVTNFANFAIVLPNLYDSFAKFLQFYTSLNADISRTEKRYQETVNSLLSSFACTFISENKNFHFISTLNNLQKLVHA